MSDVEPMAESLLPMLQGDGITAKRAEYLAKRVCNFTLRESCQLAKVSEKQVHRWREADETFRYLDTEGMTDLRKKFSTEYIDMQFTRNFHLVLEKDFKVLYKDAIEAPLTDDDKAYLAKIRQHYTPQSLAMIKQLLGGGTVDQPFDFTRLTMRIKTEQIEVTHER